MASESVKRQFNDLALSNKQIWKAENPHPCKNVQVKSDSWCFLIGGSVWWMFRWFRSRAFLFRCLLLSWFHRWRSHSKALCLLKRFEKRKREKCLSKVMNVNISQHFQRAHSLQTSFFVIIVVLNDSQIKSSVKIRNQLLWRKKVQNLRFLDHKNLFFVFRHSNDFNKLSATHNQSQILLLLLLSIHINCYLIDENETRPAQFVASHFFATQ